MFKKLFGQTDEEQLQYLQWRSIATVIGAVVCILLAIIVSEVFMPVLIAGLWLIWGLGVSKRLFGITTIGALFSGNVVMGVLLFLLFMLVSVFAGIIFALLGIGRYIYLLVKRGGNKD